MGFHATLIYIGIRTSLKEIYHHDQDLIISDYFRKIPLTKIVSHDSESGLYDSVSSTFWTKNLVDFTRRLVCRFRPSDKMDILKKSPFEPKPLVGILSLDRKRTYYLYSSTHHFGDPSVYDLLHGHLATSELAPRNLLDFRTHVSSLLTLHRESKKYSKGSRRSRRYSHRLIVSGIYPHTISNADIPLIWNSL